MGNKEHIENLSIQTIIDEIEDRLNNARYWDNNEVEFALVYLLDWIKNGN
jgi:hypothetical protein